ncbi:hypothetical protein PHYPSEUDO_005550 [Phytophthora pseudosyringae]|uniref:Uncharacterized protein n=1 Tax=Phytophthora pseudosyringae TaxID=221518 RepID=A0A8T1WHS0_9STRA|nr:hypothetical protein PHYPSEUDO_005550 [Phytophthora pseudosyringae]
MEFLQEDGDDAFVAALSFLDEFSPDSGANCKKRTRRRAVAKKEELEEEKKHRKAELNEKRKLLRKAGVYQPAA